MKRRLTVLCLLCSVLIWAAACATPRQAHTIRDLRPPLLGATDGFVDP